MDARSLNLVAALVVALHDELNDGLAEAGVPGPSAAAALATLHSYPNQGVDALSRVLGLTGSGAVRLVAGLVEQGLVDKQPGHDGRSVALRLTKAGHRDAERIVAVRRDRMRAAFAGLTAAERRQLATLAERILGNLTSGREHADRICRLCDDAACPDRKCPVEQALSP